MIREPVRGLEPTACAILPPRPSNPFVPYCLKSFPLGLCYPSSYAIAQNYCSHLYVCGSLFQSLLL